MLRPVIDALFRLGYRQAFRVARCYWWLRRPLTHGAGVALWHDGRVLVIKNSYVDYHSLPGGYVRRGESARDAARRELAEELGLHLAADQLQLAVEVTHPFQYRRDHVCIFAADVDTKPKIEVDNREVVAARWLSPDEALALDLFPPLRRHIEQRSG